MSQTRRQYPFHLIEPKWQQCWDQEQTFRAWNPGEAIPLNHPFAQRHGLAGARDAASLPRKCYILDMFPYPSGAGLHVGHPEGYTATDILARYKRAQGWHVLHPMGWDAFGLPAEQYAIKTGQHPRVTTNENIATFKRQIQSLGFSYDWSREVDTTDPDYFRWTQWIFLKLYHSWFNPMTNKAEAIETLPIPSELELKEEGEVRRYKDSKRLAYVTEAPVWWCEALGTVLANEEVIDGKSEIGGHPVVRKPMRQWMLRITAYAERLLQDLDTVDWSESLKEMQRNWIGRSEGAEVDFEIADFESAERKAVKIRVFTTRPDTLFGATYMVLAPEHKLVADIATPARGAVVGAYRAEVSKKSDLERTELAKDKTGVFTGAYAINPVNGERIPIWIADYVLASYGTGAIMAVPAHDERDWEFADKFGLPIRGVVSPELRSAEGGESPCAAPPLECFVGDGYGINSANAEVSLNGLPTKAATRRITEWLESKGLGKKTVNYKLRDWLFSRQRYWGEPFPIVWKKDAEGNLYHEALPESALPVVPPQLDDYKPTADGQPPLARAKEWMHLPDGSQRETNTMPQWAGSCWYYLRYLDTGNDNTFVSPEAERYWMGSAPLEQVKHEGEVSPFASTPQRFNASTKPGVDLYVGGTEHAVLHLLYARFWHKVLFDLGYVTAAEPFFKLVNQGIILGEDGQKMSKARGNVVNPDDMVSEFGADAFRLYEMFMGPLEMVKPWSTKGVEGVYRFLGRVWRLLVDEQSETEFEQALTAAAEPTPALLDKIKLKTDIQDAQPTLAQSKALHACIKKVTEDLDGLRFNTAISALMVFINEAMSWTVKPRSILGEFLVLLQPFAPHIAEELWTKLASHAAVVREAGRNSNVALAYQPWPEFDAAMLVEDTLEIAVQVNGKVRDRIVVSAQATPKEIEAVALGADRAQPFLQAKAVKKVIVVPGKLVNIVTG